jgi:hypothetical protein
VNAKRSKEGTTRIEDGAHSPAEGSAKTRATFGWSPSAELGARAEHRPQIVRFPTLGSLTHKKLTD